MSLENSTDEEDMRQIWKVQQAISQKEWRVMHSFEENKPGQECGSYRKLDFNGRKSFLIIYANQSQLML